MSGEFLGATFDSPRSTWQNPSAMSLLNSVKDVVVGQAMKLATSPRVSKLMGDPRLMNAAMKAMSLGGAVKTNMDKAGRLAAGVFGLATQDEVATLRTTIQNLEDTVATLEHQKAGGGTPSSSFGGPSSSGPSYGGPISDR